MSSQKRKRGRRASPDYTADGERSPAKAPSTGPFVEAHEANIIRDRPDMVHALTAKDHEGGKGGLILWQGDEMDSGEVWVDRYDARLLLSSLSGPNHQINASPPSPTGWSDLPSDAEDTFFFSPEEFEDIQREKRRKIIDANREERLRALRESEPGSAQKVDEDWGGEDEEPDETQRILMERTAKHLMSSPNPGQLEMRILTNHGADPRFSFLRGRWRNAWRSIKLIIKGEREDMERNTKTNAVGGLVAYGDSDEDEDDDGIHKGGETKNSTSNVTDESVQEARRARAREWSQKRKEKRDN